MMADCLRETALESEHIYRGRILNLRVDKVRVPNGATARREVVEHKPAVAVLAENERSEILLIRQHRYAAGEDMIELPAGIVEDGEDYAKTAIRELQEETGWKPRTVRKVAEFYTSPGFSDELLILFYAVDLVASKLPEDDDEFIEPAFVGEKELQKLLDEGNIRDCKTLFGIYWWLNHLRNR